MQMVKKIAVILLSIWLAILIFMPKKELYYALEHLLVKNEIKLNEKDIKENLFGLNLNEVEIFYDGVRLAEVSDIEIKTFLFYTNVNVKDIKIDDSFKSMIPFKLNDINVTYSILLPMKAKIYASGDFGNVAGYIDFNRTIHLDFIKVGNIKKLQRELKKNKNGWYYETKF
jgi:hypothetical protein